VKRTTTAALVAAALLTGLAITLSRHGAWQVLFVVMFVGLLVALLVGAGRAFGWSKDKLREHHWRHEEGRYHAFAGVPLQVHDDGRHVWLGGAGLLRVLGRSEPDDVLAARMPGQWKRDAQGRLQLRVDAVIEHLAHMPGRDDPRIQKFRRYLERDVLFPADQRHERERPR
jgi:hypothetical protein